MADTFSAREVLRIARGQIGTTEHGFNNDVKYGRWYGMNEQPWCDMFVSWVLNRAGNVDKYKSAYTPGGAAFWKGRDRWVDDTDLRRGDIVYFDFPGDGVDRISHVGIVEKVLSNGTVVCVEGNTSPGTGGSQRDGGGVYRRVRPLSYIVGGGRPSYDKAKLPPPLLTEGSRGKSVREVQKALRILGAELTVTGTFDADTTKAVLRFQGDKKLEIDGEVGKFTWRALGKALQRAGKPQETEKRPGEGEEDSEAEAKASEIAKKLNRKRTLRLVRTAQEDIDRLEEQIDRLQEKLDAELDELDQ
jgi:Putative peptidoglycan binding domain/CHAP domain